MITCLTLRTKKSKLRNLHQDEITKRVENAAKILHIEKLLENYGQEKVVLGVRPENIQVTRQMKEEDNIETIIYFKQSMGAEDILNLKVNDTVFRAVAPPNLKAKAGEKIFAAIKVDLVHLFDPDTELRLSLP